MKNFDVVNLEQGTKEWLEFRKGLIMASEVAPIFGESPYQTALQLMEYKLFDKKEVITDSKDRIFKYGHSVEEASRNYFKETRGIEFIPIVARSTVYPWLGSSLDGYCEKNNIILEAKYVGADTQQKMRETKKPLTHRILCRYGRGKGYSFSDLSRQGYPRQDR